MPVMIEKFISIKNIGRFRDCSARGDVTFRKLNLLFAENGRGKTTLCAILRSLQSGQPELILERKTLGTGDPASVEIRLGGNNLTFGSNGWSTPYQDIAVFDSVFVHDNVYAGDYVDHDHKKNLYRVIVGAQGVELAEKIDDLDDKIHSANTDIRTKKEAVSRTAPNGVTLEAYLKWKPDENIENKIQEKNKEITNLQRTLEKTTEIQSKGLLSKIALPDFPSDFLTILNKQLEDITTDAETRVRQQIAAHNMGAHGETWLSQGLGFITNGKCPFCGQRITGIDLIAAYRSHFNVAYKNLKQEVAKLTQKVIDSIGESSLNPVQQTFSSNLTLVEFWKQFTEVDLPSFDFEDARTKYSTLLN
ncbi:MAG TPA: hypothetical protein ENN79_04220, partial [Desulfobacteraceae bacterium]|nr:hypothetical protein [Desulfobacteraceae bacterium]